MIIKNQIIAFFFTFNKDAAYLFKFTFIEETLVLKIIAYHS